MKALLERRSDLFATVVEGSPMALVLIDVTGRIALVNQRTEELFGYERSELVGQRVGILVPERFRTSHARLVGKYLGDPKMRPMGAGSDLWGRRKDGKEIPVEIGLSPIETTEGTLTLASIVDIGVRKRGQAAQERLAAIVEGSDDAIISKTLEGIITTWNGGAERLFGYAAEEAIGRSVLMLVPERYAADERRILEQIRRGTRASRVETVRRRKDGSEVDVSVTVSPLHGEAGEIIGASSIAHDITELNRRDIELQRSNAELEKFAYLASHELQEPLRMVANYTELLAQRYRGRLDEKADMYIHYATDGARRMQKLVSDILAYSRVSTQGAPLIPVASGDVLESVVLSLRKLIEDAGGSVEHGILPVVSADEGQLGQLFQNLIVNAIKFRSTAPPRVIVAAVPNGDHWLFSVADNGIGMDMGHADHIFQMFHRLHGHDKYEGSGIGLAIAKRIVERHGGRIWVESQPGAGATFYFTLRAK